MSQGSERPRLLAFVDEAGHRSSSATSSDHFVMAAVAWKAPADSRAVQLLSDMRQTTGRRPGHVIHFQKLNHHDRLAAASAIGREARWLRVITVSVCKRELPPPPKGFTEDKAYLWSYRLLLERLSWLAQRSRCDLDMTLAHVVRFKKETLRSYEATLREIADCTVAWDRVPRGASISVPEQDERLQLADVTASAVYHAFEPKHGFTERRYLEELAPALWRRDGNLLSYGLKVVPRPTAETYGWCSQL